MVCMDACTHRIYSPYSLSRIKAMEDATDAPLEGQDTAVPRLPFSFEVVLKTRYKTISPRSGAFLGFPKTLSGKSSQLFSTISTIALFRGGWLSTRLNKSLGASKSLIPFNPLAFFGSGAKWLFGFTKKTEDGPPEEQKKCRYTHM